jgi:quinohemoprotein ethanol dehydrogenase
VAGGDAAAAAGVAGAGRLLTFALGGRETVPAAAPLQPRVVAEIDVEASPEEIATGSDRYHQWCAVCHGVGAVGGGVLPDLRYASSDVHEGIGEIVLGGSRASLGMPRFDDVLSAEELTWIQAYVLSRAPR